MSRKIFLIGMPGAGKTYWGKQLAAAMQVKFIDLDEFVEDLEDESILALFARFGEQRFREMERNALLQLLERDEELLLISCGGGTPCFFDNIQVIKNAGCVIYLRAGMETLLGRLFMDFDARPLMQVDSIHEKLYQLMVYRAPFYEQADYIVDVETLSLDTFEEIIHSCTSAPL